MRRRELLRRGGALVGASVAVGVGGSKITTQTVRAHPGPYEPYGSIDVEGAKEAVVDPERDVTYLATTSGYAVVDVAAPDRPQLLADVREPLADREDGPLRGIFDVKLDATDPTTLLVVGPANPLRGAISGALVVDVSDPENPEERAFHETSFPIHNCFVRDGVAFLTGNDGGRNPIVTLDVETGEERGRWALADVDEAWDDVPNASRSVHDVYVHEDRAFVALWDAGTWVLDVSDPASPTALGSVDAPGPSMLADRSGAEARREATLPPGNHHYVATDESGTLLGVGRESWALPAEGDETTNQSADAKTQSETAASTEAGDTAYVGGPSGIDLWDVSDPEAPELRATIPAPASPEPTYGGVWTTAHNFELAAGTLYSSWYRGGVKRHDVSDPAAPREVTWWRDPDAASFWTAQLAHAGEREGFFVASNWGVGDVPGGLYTFPDHAGEQADPPDTLPDGTSTPYGPRTRTPSGAATAEEATVAGGTSAASGRNSTVPGGNSTASDGTPAEDGISAPGFGVGAAVSALGVAAWRIARRTRE
ncbi:LVIVD repeat-containing protein [Halobellus salinisoli]|uniref:LVIVD repeat-containing protein n=1 Tax=Halobellus salinisoli TaxID=3108500 RepID=UPI00300865C2